MKKMNPFRYLFFVATAFFLSGGCGLVYEFLWTRYLADLMGGTSLSHFVVLSVFMGGLALGAMLIGRLVDRGRNGLVLYGWLEVGIGFYAVLFPFLFRKASDIYILIGSSFEPGSTALLALKLLFSSLLIALPSLAMGGTLPAVTRFLTRSQEGLRRNISLLYAINSLGAVIGILAGGFILVYRYGLDGSMIYTGVINILLGAVVLAVARVFSMDTVVVPESESIPHRRLEESHDAQLHTPQAVKRAVIAAGLSGFAAMALQIAWLRYFVMILGSTHSVFTIVVAAFVFGIGLGALLVRSHWVGRLPLPTVLTCAFALTAITLGLGLFGYYRLPFEISRILAIINHTPFTWPFYVLLKFGICFMLMLLPTIASGMILPLCVRIAARGGDHLGHDVAVVYAVNTLGALLGIGITSQLFFRMMTLPRTMQLIFLIYLAATAYLAYVMEEKGRKRILALSGALLAANLIFWQPWSPALLHVGRVDFGQDPPFTYEDFVDLMIKQTVLVDDRQGPDVQVTVVDAFPPQQEHFRVMFINGKPDASNKKSTDFETETMLGQLPMLLHPDPKNVFVLGLGSGITSGEILKFPELEKLTTAELAAEVFEASKHFAEDNNRFWENPKHRIVIEDGRTFLRLKDEKYDVISLEPSNVWRKGMHGLFSEDFFRLVKSRLAPGGVVVQWIHTYELDDLTFNLILKTFSQVFPRSSIFQVWHGDVILVGYDENWQFNPQNLEQRFYQPQIYETHKKIRNANPDALLLREIMSRDSFKEYTSVVRAPVNTINFPVLEQVAEYGQFIQKPLTVFNGYDSRINPDDNNLLINDYFSLVGSDPARLKAAMDLIEPGKNDKLRNSLNLMLMNGVLQESEHSTQELVKIIFDPQIREIVSHPLYHKASEHMTAEEAFKMLAGELLLWNKAGSQLWSPDPERLLQLYDRAASKAGQEGAARLALDIVVTLAEGGACEAAMPFLRIIEDKGGVGLDRMEPIDIISSFFCEAKKGDPLKALGWWDLIEQNKIPVTKYLLADKTTLDIKLGGQPPPPVYGRLPDRR